MRTNQPCVLLVWLGLAALLLAGAVCAQEQTYTLRYKFVPNQTIITTMTMTGLMPMQMTPGPEANIPAMGFDVNMDMNMTMSQLCRSVDPDGTGHLETTFPLMSTHTSMQVGNETVETLFKWEKGNLSMSVNGQEQPREANLDKLAGILGATMKATMTPLGRSTPDPETAKLLQEMLNLNGGMNADIDRLSALTSQLPERPVKVGDTWKISDNGKLGNATLTGTSDLKLAAVEDFEGVRAARIEGEARLNIAGEMPANAMGMPANVNITRNDMAIAFVNFLDLQSGRLLVSRMNMTQNMALMISMGEGNKAVHLPATIDNSQMTAELRSKVQ